MQTEFSVLSVAFESTECKDAQNPKNKKVKYFHYYTLRWNE